MLARSDAFMQAPHAMVGQVGQRLAGQLREPGAPRPSYGWSLARASGRGGRAQPVTGGCSTRPKTGIGGGPVAGSLARSLACLEKRVNIFYPFPPFCICLASSPVTHDPDVAPSLPVPFEPAPPAPFSLRYLHLPSSPSAALHDTSLPSRPSSRQHHFPRDIVFPLRAPSPL